MKTMSAVLFYRKNFLLLLLPLSLTLLFSPLSVNAAETKKDLPVINPFSKAQPKVEVVSDTVEYDRNSNKVIAKNNVVLRDGATQITCDYAEVATDSKKVFAKGHVVIFYNGKAVSRGSEIHYDFENQSGSFPEGRVVTIPWIINGKEMNQIQEGVHVVKDGKITTCDYEHPHYELRATKVTIKENDKLIAKNVVIYVLDKPVFWWPIFIFPLGKNDNLPFSISFGYNSRHGYYAEASAGFGVTEHISGKAHLDFRSLRGAGGGLDLNYDFTDQEGSPKQLAGAGVIKTYITQDKRAPRYSISETDTRTTDSRTRGRATWIHRTDIDKHTNVILRYNRIADEYFLSDFFRQESHAEIEPQSFATLTKNTENFGLLVHNEKKMNDFESTVERLPQVQFDWRTQPFLGDKVFYESQASYNNLAIRFNRNDQLNKDVSRYDNYHEWSLPLNWRNIKFTPFVGARGTYYSREVEDPQDALRALFTTGADLRTHFYKTYDVATNKAGIEINQLRHVIEPVAQYKQIKSNVSDETLTNFDSIDRLDDTDILTVGVENRFQTKRVIDGRVQRVDVVSLNTYLSYEANPDGHSLGSQIYPPYEDGVTKSQFTVGSQEIVLRPYNWLQSETRFDYDLGDMNMRIFNQDLLFKKGRFKVVFGYRRIRDFENFGGNEQYLFDGSYIINPLWTVGGYMRWYAGDVQEWQLIATRDLHDFILDLGYNVRNSDIQDNSKEIFFNFRLKQFPELALRSGSRASFSEPRIGQTVAGSNSDNQVPSQNEAFTAEYFR